MEIIGIAGKAEAGKDTAAKVLELQYGFKKMSLAYPLKKLCSEVFEIPLEVFNNATLKESKCSIIINDNHIKNLLKGRTVDEFYKIGLNKEIKSPRELLQFVGTELFRNCIKSTYWIDLFLDEIDGISRVVVPDVRFRNEREALLTKKALLILIQRGEEVKGEEHISEQSLGYTYEYDYVLKNTGSKEDLWQALSGVYLFNKSVDKGLVNLI